MRSQIASLLDFTRIEHTLFSLPLLFAGAWLGAGRQMPPLRTLGLVVLAGVGARIVGMSMNRIFDRKLDALNPRTARRELPAGRMSVPAAVMVAVVGLAAYLVACWLLGPLVLKLSPIPAVVLVGYSLLKRFTLLCHFGIGLCLALAPPSAWVAAAGNVQFGADILLLSLFTFCWMSGSDIIYALQDLESDRQTGVHSIPAALGGRRAQFVAAMVHVIALACATALLLVTGGGPAAWAALAVAAGAFVCAYVPAIPPATRFFPILAIAGIAGAAVAMLGQA